MSSHPYISGPGNLTQMIGYLRKNFPATVTSETVKKLGLASNNESYVINALHFIGLIDGEGKRTERGHDVMATHEEEKFRTLFAGLVRDGYKELFELRGDDAWTMSKNELIGYFRSADKTSDLIGARQAGVFQAFRALAGHENASGGTKAAKSTSSPSKTPKPKAVKLAAAKSDSTIIPPLAADHSKKGVSLSVRIEINLPAEASAETYDNIFKSIRANLMNE